MAAITVSHGYRYVSLIDLEWFICDDSDDDIVGKDPCHD